MDSISKMLADNIPIKETAMRERLESNQRKINDLINSMLAEIETIRHENILLKENLIPYDDADERKIELDRLHHIYFNALESWRKRADRYNPETPHSKALDKAQSDYRNACRELGVLHKM